MLSGMVSPRGYMLAGSVEHHDGVGVGGRVFGDHRRVGIHGPGIDAGHDRAAPLSSLGQTVPKS